MSTNDIKILTDLNEIEQLPELMLSPHFGMNYFVDFSDWTNGLIGATRIQIHAINSHFDRKHISEYFELLFQCHIKGTRYTYTAELKSPARCHIFMEAFLHQFLNKRSSDFSIEELGAHKDRDDSFSKTARKFYKGKIEVTDFVSEYKRRLNSWFNNIESSRYKLWCISARKMEKLVENIDEWGDQKLINNLARHPKASKFVLYYVFWMVVDSYHYCEDTKKTCDFIINRLKSKKYRRNHKDFLAVDFFFGDVDPGIVIDRLVPTNLQKIIPHFLLSTKYDTKEYSKEIDIKKSPTVRLLEACDKGDKKAVSFILKKAKEQPPIAYDFCSIWTDPIFHCACRNGNPSIVKALIDAGIDINVPDRSGQTAFCIIAEKNDIKLAKLLIENGADFNIHSRLMEYPLSVAVKNGSYEMVEFLLKNKADSNFLLKGDDPLIHHACRSSTPSVLRLITSHNPGINTTGSFNRTALHVASIETKRKDAVEIVKILLENGANPNLTNIEGNKPIDLAKLERRDDVVKALLDHTNMS